MENQNTHFTFTKKTASRGFVEYLIHKSGTYFGKIYTHAGFNFWILDLKPSLTTNFPRGYSDTIIYPGLDHTPKLAEVKKWVLNNL